ncbi:MAG: hypothetical protein ACOC8A_00070 [bacterium]
MPATLAELDLPLVVQEVAGVDRIGDVCSSGVPLPHGLLAEPEGIALFGPEGRPVPAQFRVLERWRDEGRSKGDGSVKWLLVSFFADAKAGQTALYRLKAGENPRAQQPVTLEATAEGYRLNGLLFEEDFSAPFQAVLTDAEGTQIAASELPLEWSVWERGPVRSCLKVESPTVEGKFGLLAFIYAYAGKARWDLSITLKNTPKKPQGPLYVRDFSVIWQPGELSGASRYHLGGEWGRRYAGDVAPGEKAYLYQASAGTEKWDKFYANGREWRRAFAESYRGGPAAEAGVPSFRGYRVLEGGKEVARSDFAQGQVMLKNNRASAFAAVRDFLHQYPKAAEVREGTVQLRLWPIYYQGYDGLQWLDDATRKTHEITFELGGPEMTGPDAEHKARAYDRPLLAFPGVDWMRETEVRFYISRRFKDVPSKVHTELTPSNHNWLTLGAPSDRSRRRYRGAGGDAYFKTGDPNQAYHLRRGMLSSSGITPFWVDDYSYPEDRGVIDPGYMQPPRQTGRYRKGTKHHGYRAWNTQHFCIPELFDGWRIFGDPVAYDAIEKVGVYHRFLVDEREEARISNPRVSALPMQNLTEVYRVTGKPEILEDIKTWEKVAWEEQINKARGYYASKAVGKDFYVFKDRLDLAGPVQIAETWPNSSMIDGLTYSYFLTGNENAHDMILGIADWLLDEAFAGWPYGFFYKVPLRPDLQKQMMQMAKESNEKGKVGRWNYRLSLPSLARAYLWTGDSRYHDPFTEAVRHLRKDRRRKWEDISGAGGWRATGNHFEWTNWADRALEEEREDRAPPAAVADLKAETPGNRRVRLTWTTPMGAVRLKIKWASRPMLDRIDWKTQADGHANWWAGENVADEPAAQPGRTQSAVVQDVAPGEHYFAIRTFDAANNRSKISNQVAVEVK